MRTLSDIDKMPFGKFKGTAMKHIPCEYFHYLWHAGMKTECATSNVALYIRDHIKAFKQENEDLIWT